MKKQFVLLMVCLFALNTNAQWRMTDNYNGEVTQYLDNKKGIMYRIYTGQKNKYGGDSVAVAQISNLVGDTAVVFDSVTYQNKSYPVVAIISTMSNNIQSRLAKITLPQSLSIIGQQCMSVTPHFRGKFSLPDSTKFVNNKAFYRCGLDSLIINEGVREIAHFAFSQCMNLRYIELPANDVIYHGGIFEECNEDAKIVVRATTPYESLIELLYQFLRGQYVDESYMKTKVYVPDESLELFRNKLKPRHKDRILPVSQLNM